MWICKKVLFVCKPVSRGTLKIYVACKISKECKQLPGGISKLWQPSLWTLVPLTVAGLLFWRSIIDGSCLTLCCSCLEGDTEALRKLNYANFIAPNLLVMSLIKLHCEYGVCLAGDCDSHRLLDWLLQPKHLDKHAEWCHPSNALLRVLGKVVFSRPWNYYWFEAKNKMILHLKWKSNQKKLEIDKEINTSLKLDILIIE